jgi:hypothetical protein
MGLKYFKKMMSILFILFTVLSGCAAPVRVVIEPPIKIDGFMNAKWGASVEEAKRAIEKDGNYWFKDSTDHSPYALYASGNYLGSPSIFSYFFTPKSKKLYRVDVTFDDLRVYEKARDHLIEKFRKPSYSQKDIDHWSWKDKSLVILQRNTANVQISYSSGLFLELNQKERG